MSKEDAKQALRAALRGNTASFRAEYTNGKGEHVADINIVSKELLNGMLAQEVKKGRLVVVKEDGVAVAYERSVHEDQYDVKTRIKLRYPNYGTAEQRREIIKKFPWESK